MSVRDDIRKVVLSVLPPESKVTRVEYEGPSIVIFVANPPFIVERGEYVRTLAKTLKKRIIIRGDESVRRSEEEARDFIRGLLGDLVDYVYFSKPFGEVYVYLSRPLPEAEAKRIEREVFASTGWRALIEAGVPRHTLKLSASYIKEVRDFVHAMEVVRKEMLSSLGVRIHRDLVLKEFKVAITTLGGAQEVGRSALLLKTQESTVLIDFGIKPSSAEDELPLLHLADVDLDELDAVIATHAHMDHIGSLPLLYKYGYKGPVYMTEPTKYLTYVLLTDYLQIREREGRPPLYSMQDVVDVLAHTITLEYEEVTDIAPDIKLTFYNAGHELGSSIVHLHIGNGLYNVVYTGDFKYGQTKLFDKAHSRFKRVELLIMESTYGGRDDVQPPRHESEQKLVEVIRRALNKGGKVLIPVFSTGRAQEILVCINDAINEGRLPKIPIFIDGMVLQTLNTHMTFPQFLPRAIQERVLNGENPFVSDYTIPIERAKRPEERVEQVAQIVGMERPAVILAPHGMLNGGPVLDYFAHMAEDSKNVLVFVSYQAEGTLGRRILDLTAQCRKPPGGEELVVRTSIGETKVKMEMPCEHIPGFSGHSDRVQLLNYVRDLEPKPHKIMLVHGEPSKILSLAITIELKHKITTISPRVFETIRLV